MFTREELLAISDAIDHALFRMDDEKNELNQYIVTYKNVRLVFEHEHDAMKFIDSITEE